MPKNILNITFINIHFPTLPYGSILTECVIASSFMRTDIKSIVSRVLPEPGKQHGTHNKHVTYSPPPHIQKQLTGNGQVPIGVIKAGIQTLFN